MNVIHVSSRYIRNMSLASHSQKLLYKNLVASMRLDYHQLRRYDSFKHLKDSWQVRTSALSYFRESLLGRSSPRTFSSHSSSDPPSASDMATSDSQVENTSESLFPFAANISRYEHNSGEGARLKQTEICTMKFKEKMVPNPRFVTLDNPMLDLNARNEVIPFWAGKDLEILVYESLENFVPSHTIPLSGNMFNAPIRNDIVHQVVVWQLAKRRAGLASTKDRSEVSGSGKKVYPQKGSGRARHGDKRAPIFKGGGRVHGPKPRDWSYPLPVKIRQQGLRSVLSSKFSTGNLWIIDNPTISQPKTSILLNALANIKFSSVYYIDHDTEAKHRIDHNVDKAAFILHNVLTMNYNGVNVYDLLSFEHIIITKRALAMMHRRFSPYDSYFV